MKSHPTEEKTTGETAGGKAGIEPGENPFVMLGVIHRDPEGPSLLDRWLEALLPQVITLEFSDYGRRFRDRMGPFYRQRIEEVYKGLKRKGLPCYDNALSRALLYMEMPFEFDGATRFGRLHGIPVYLVDMDYYSYLRLREIERLFNPENLERLLSEDSDKSSNYERTMARLYFEKGLLTTPYTEEMAIRDRYMSRRIKVLMLRYRGRRFLHVTGWRHLEDPRGFFGSMNPKKVYIHDKTFCL